MATHEEHLRETLAELHRELDDVGTVTAETQQMLRSTLQEIQDHLDESAAQEHLPTWSESLNEAVLEFEESHPTIVGLVRRTLDLLGQIGI